jgi:FdhE protein
MSSCAYRGIVVKEKEPLTVDDIQRTVAAVKAERPAYEKMLTFYEKIFLAREKAKELVRLTSIQVPDKLLAMKQKEGFPLTDRAGFTVDMEASEALLRALFKVAAETNEVLAEAGKKLADALEKGKLDASTLFSAVLSEASHSFRGLAEELDVGENILAFFGYNSVWPSVSLCAEQLAAYLDDEVSWKKGYCPVCGSPPALSILRDEGNRFLFCSFCGHEWHTQRIYCPFCNNQDHTKLHYFFGEEEKCYRVDACDVCKKYLKTIDTRELKHPLYPFLEQVSTLHLDLLAREQGLESGSPVWLQT